MSEERKSLGTDQSERERERERERTKALFLSLLFLYFLFILFNSEVFLEREIIRTLISHNSLTTS
jgi:hypothetical protein